MDDSSGYCSSVLRGKRVDVGGVNNERRADAVIGGTQHRAAGSYNTAGRSRDI